MDDTTRMIVEQLMEENAVIRQEFKIVVEKLKRTRQALDSVRDVLIRYVDKTIKENEQRHWGGTAKYHPDEMSEIKSLYEQAIKEQMRQAQTQIHNIFPKHGKKERL